MGSYTHFLFFFSKEPFLCVCPQTSLFSGFLFCWIPRWSFSGRERVRLGHSLLQGPDLCVCYERAQRHLQGQAGFYEDFFLPSKMSCSMLADVLGTSGSVITALLVLLLKIVTANADGGLWSQLLPERSPYVIVSSGPSGPSSCSPHFRD